MRAACKAIAGTLSAPCLATVAPAQELIEPVVASARIARGFETQRIRVRVEEAHP